MRDLAKTVPPAVLAAAMEALAEGARIVGNHLVAVSAWREHMRLDRQRVAAEKADLTVRAEAIFRWGMSLHDDLPRAQLQRLHGTREREAKTLTIVNHRIELKPDGTAPGGALTTRLDLMLSDEGALFRHHEWFDGYRVSGGGQLNTQDSLLGLHSEMLRQVHDVIANGQVWDRIVHGLRQLAKDLKDR